MALASRARQYLKIESQSAVTNLPDNLPFLILSGGSNVLLPPQIDATVLSVQIKGIRLLSQDDNSVHIEVGAGENWHDLVVSCTQQGWFGLENLALIFGRVGAAPVQNIGAYGREIADVFVSARAFDLYKRTWHTFYKDECEFAYRDSMFKKNRQFLITSICLKLHKNPYAIHTSYGDLAQHAHILQQPDAHNVMKAVIALRTQKLPDPAILANCGSYFHNPIISQAQFTILQAKYPAIAHYPLADGRIKIAAGWLIDKAGLKGMGVAPIFTHTKQALVLTNHAPRISTTNEVLIAERYIQSCVRNLFDIELQREPILC